MTAVTTTEEAALKNYIDPVQMQKDLTIDTSNINEELAQQPARYMEYAKRAVYARAQADRAKTSFEIEESRLDHQYRTTLKEENPKVTEPAIRAAVVGDPRWKTFNTRMIQAQTIYRLAEKAERAFDDRKDMVLQIARNLAKEMEGGLRVVSNQDNRERMLGALKRAGEGATA